jgi:monofunctional biosynthetic peptidoglycan transglycosylase
MTDGTSAASPRQLVRTARVLLLALTLPAGALVLAWSALPDPGPLARTPPATTALIEQRRAEARAAGRPFHPDRRWVPLERISPRLVEAVVAAEDARFFIHGGFDWEALREALRHNLARRRYARGASTITQQLAKNLYLGTEKSLLRKGREALLSVRLERRLEKRRILALYLNVAEWGQGSFGAEAGARRHFGAGADGLTTAQAVLLAAMLPAPRQAGLAPAPRWLVARARGLLDRLRDEQVIPPDEHAAARAELERYLGAAPAVTPGEPEAEPPPDDSTTEVAPPAGEPIGQVPDPASREPVAPVEASDGVPAPAPEETPRPAEAPAPADPTRAPP